MIHKKYCNKLEYQKDQSSDYFQEAGALERHVNSKTISLWSHTGQRSTENTLQFSFDPKSTQTKVNQKRTTKCFLSLCFKKKPVDCCITRWFYTKVFMPILFLLEESNFRTTWSIKPVKAKESPFKAKSVTWKMLSDFTHDWLGKCEIQPSPLLFSKFL